MGRSRPMVRLAVLLAVVIVAVGLVPATAVAQSGGDVGGTVTVAEGETVDEVDAIAGTVAIEGTVTGDVSAVAGDVRVTGDVQGDLEAAGGSVVVDGTVDGDVESASGSFELAEAGTVGGDLQAGAGGIVVDGMVDGDAALGADTIQLGDEAAIAGDLRYDGALEGNTGAVAGEITQDSSLGFDLGQTLQPLASWLASLYVLGLNLLLGAALLALFPRFSDGVADRVAQRPVRSGLLGLGVLVAVPLVLVALTISIVGIPFAIVGGFAFAFVVWVGIVYGRFAVAAWLLGAIDVENRWLALVVGMVGAAVVAQIPWLGGLVNLAVFLLGLGALASGLYGHRRAVRDREPDRGGAVPPGGPASD